MYHHCNKAVFGQTSVSQHEVSHVMLRVICTQLIDGPTGREHHYQKGAMYDFCAHDIGVFYIVCNAELGFPSLSRDVSLSFQ
jgi:hypothetical protein